jgi:hypothetical protein
MPPFGVASEEVLMRSVARGTPEVRSARPFLAGELRDCPLCRAEDAVFIPSDFGVGEHVALVRGIGVDAPQVLCRHCRTSLGVVGASFNGSKADVDAK